MKNKVWTFTSTIMLFVPWSIFLLRTNAWALRSPVAKILISCYAAFMIFSGIFTIWGYAKKQVRNLWMQICCVINGLYGVVGIAVFCLMRIS
nr:hypothetical protein [uncultured Blautia sp.]